MQEIIFTRMRWHYIFVANIVGCPASLFVGWVGIGVVNSICIGLPIHSISLNDQ